MENEQHKDRSPAQGRMLAGVFLLVIGGVLLLQKLGFAFPYWLFTWPVLLIAIGLFLALKHNFRGGPWFIMILVGLVFLFDIIAHDLSLSRYFWPVIIISIGLLMVLKPKGGIFTTAKFRKKMQQYHAEHQQPFIPPHQENAQRSNDNPYVYPHAAADEEYLDSTAVFGGVRKVIVSKNFRGGEAVSIFGGHEIDLSKSDINGTVELELTQVCGGAKLVVPKHWNIKSEVVAFLGGIEDKRVTDPSMVDFSKTLLLKGTTVLGGLDIRNY